MPKQPYAAHQARDAVRAYLARKNREELDTIYALIAEQAARGEQAMERSIPKNLLPFYKDELTSHGYKVGQSTREDEDRSRMVIVISWRRA